MRMLAVGPDRVQLLARQPRNKYFELYHRIDIGLDTVPYNGHTTSLDSFWMGVPVVTMIGKTVVGRAGWCQSCNLGLKELAAENEEWFIQIAAKLAADRDRLKVLRGDAAKNEKFAADGWGAICAKHRRSVSADVARLGGAISLKDWRETAPTPLP